MNGFELCLWIEKSGVKRYGAAACRRRWIGGVGVAVDWLVGQRDTRLTDEKFKPDETFGECLFNCGSID